MSGLPTGENKPKLSFGFKKSVPPSTAPTRTQPRDNNFGLAFDDNNDMGLEQQSSHTQSDSSSASKGTSSARASVPSGAGVAPASRAARQRQKEALQLDENVFDYDGVYDRMKSFEKEAEKRKENDKKKRDPKYIKEFLESSEQRKKDRIRAEAKLIQREREQEGDAFVDKEAFVTDAYKQQMEELKEAEAREKQQEEVDRAKGKGVGKFYRDILSSQEAAHEAAVAASLVPSQGEGSQDDSGEQEYDSSANKERTHIELAKEARDRGLNAELNDDNQLVDQRSILSAGLNVLRKPKGLNNESDTVGTPDQASSKYPSAQSKGERHNGAQKMHEAREALRSRQSKLIEDQLLQLDRKRAAEEEQEREEKKRRLAGERHTDVAAISSAKERYLERKRKKEEEKSK